MKFRHILLIAGACGILLNSCGALRESREERQAHLERQATQVSQAICEGTFLVSIDRMIPHTGSVRQVSQYSVEVKDNVLTSYLPYFGQARQASFNGGNALDFKTEMNAYVVKPIEDGYRIQIQANTKEDRFLYTLNIYNDGSVTLDVLSDNRDPITYMGQFEFERE